jgi:sulfoacetaldehyde dehydrogenase
MWKDGALSRSVVAQPASTIARQAGLTADAALEARFLIVEEDGIGELYPFSGEKISPVLTVYRYTTFEDALEKVTRILDYQGKGHSCGIHSSNEDHITRLARAAKVSRVLVNQAHCIGTGGDFANGLDFTLSLGAGTWGGNSTCDNITYRHFVNVTRLARPIPASVPTEQELWGDYFAKYGR